MRGKLAAYLTAGTILAPAVMAYQVKTGSNWGSYQQGSGGEFTVQAVGLDLSGYKASVTSGLSADGIGRVNTFQTFCLENSTPPEYIEPNTTYDVNINTKAINGGLPSSAGGDPLSKGAGWLYSQFATGTLASYDFDNSKAQRKTDAGLLQNAIWWLEDEGNVPYTTGNKFMVAVVNQFDGDSAAAKTTGASDYGVYALNMYKSNGTLGQDQLYYKVPDGGLTLAMLGMGLAGVGFFARRRS